MTSDVQTLAERVRALEARAAVVDVLYQYSHALDYGDEATFLECFTDDAGWHADNRLTGSVMRYAGRAELAAFAAGHTRPPELFHKHVVVDPRVSVDGDRATAVSYVVMLVGAPAGCPRWCPSVATTTPCRAMPADDGGSSSASSTSRRGARCGRSCATSDAAGSNTTRHRAVEPSNPESQRGGVPTHRSAADDSSAIAAMTAEVSQ